MRLVFTELMTTPEVNLSLWYLTRVDEYMWGKGRAIKDDLFLALLQMFVEKHIRSVNCHS